MIYASSSSSPLSSFSALIIAFASLMKEAIILSFVSLASNLMPHSFLARSSISFLVLAESCALVGAFLTSTTGAGFGAGAFLTGAGAGALLSDFKKKLYTTNPTITIPITIPI